MTVVTQSDGQTPTTAFTQPFDYTKTKIGILPEANWGIFRAHETVTITTSNNVPFTVFDLYGNAAYTGTGVSRSFTQGHYFVECNGDRSQFCVLPDAYTATSFLGDQHNNGWNQAMQRDTLVGVGWRRVGMEWGDVEVSDNQYSWQSLDSAINAKLDCGILLIAAGYTPAWVNAGNFLQAYTNHVAALVQRYKGKISAIELWNEPGAGKFPGNTADWLSYLDQVITKGAQVARSIDPTLKIVGPSWWSSIAYDATAALAGTGTLATLDTFSWHDYQINDAPPDQIAWWPSGTFLISNLVQRVSLYRSAGVGSKPVFVDEIGLYGQSALGIPYPSPPTDSSSPLITWQRGMTRSIKLALLYRSAGAEAIMPHNLVLGAYSLTDPGSGIYGWEYGYRGPHPKTTALLMTCHWLNGSQFVDYRMLGEKVCLFAWRRADNTAILFAWTIEGQTASLNGTSGLTAMDVYGNTVTPGMLTETPIIYFSTTQDPATLLANVMARLPNFNLAPVVLSVANQSVKLGQPLQFPVIASDPDNDPITFSANPLPTGAVINPVTGQFSWTPGADQRGSYTITFTVTDARGMSSSTTTIINAVGDLLDNLTHRWKFDETSGLVATDSVGSCTGNLVGYGASSPWVAGKAGNGLNFNGSNRYVQLDNTQITLSNNFTIALWVYPRDAATGGLLTALEYNYQTSGFWLWLGANHVVIGGTTTTGWKVNDFALGQIQNNAWHHLVFVYDKSCWSLYVNGQLAGIAYGGNPCWGGDFVKSQTSASSIGARNSPYLNGVLDDVLLFQRTLTATEALTLYQGGNLPPTLAPIGAQNIQVGQALAFTVTGSDPNGDPLTYSASNLPGGSTFNTNTQTFAWTPTAGQTGIFTVTFTVSDGAASASQQVPITVTQSNRPPVLSTIGARSVNEGQTLSFTISATDPDGTAVTYSASGLPAGATLNSSTGAFSWTPTYSQSGSYFIIFTASDGSLTASEVVTVTVANVSRPPVLVAIGSKSVNEGNLLSFTVSATDPDGDALTYSTGSLPSGASFNSSTRTFSWTPTYSQAGSYSVMFIVSDGALTDFESITITVANVNRAPVLSPIGSKTITAGANLHFTVSATDPDGTGVVYSTGPLPAGASFNTGTHTFDWTPLAGQVGAYLVNFSVTDGLLSTNETITIAVKPAAQSTPSLFQQSFNPDVQKIEFASAANSGVYFESEPIDLQTTDNGSIRVINLDGSTVYNGAPATLNLPRGHYFVETAGDRTQFVVLPDDYAGADFLGADATDGIDPDQTAKISRIRPSWVRTANEGYWPTVQPAPDIWNWDPLDRIVAANADRKILVCAYQRPSWQTNNTEFAALFAEYARRMAERYQTQIYGIEIWNEPDWQGPHATRLPDARWATDYSGDWTDFYDELVTQASVAIRSASRKAKVYGLSFADFTSYVPLFKKFNDKGTVRKLAGVSYHDYDTDRFAADVDTSYQNEVVPSLDKKQDILRGIIGKRTAVLLDEIGLNGKSALGATNATGILNLTSSPAIDWSRGMSRAIKYALLNRAKGVELLLPVALSLAATNNPAATNYEIYGWEYGNRGPHPKTSAFLMSCYWLNGARFMGSTVIDGKVFLYTWRRADRSTVVFAWCKEGTAATLSPIDQVQITDVFGQPVETSQLGEEPLLLVPTGRTSPKKFLRSLVAAIQP